MIGVTIPSRGQMTAPSSTDAPGASSFSDGASINGISCSASKRGSASLENGRRSDAPSFHGSPSPIAHSRESSARRWIAPCRKSPASRSSSEAARILASVCAECPPVSQTPANRPHHSRRAARNTSACPHPASPGSSRTPQPAQATAREKAHPPSAATAAHPARKLRLALEAGSRAEGL